MYLYCKCSYPILVSAASTGHESYVVLRDGKRGIDTVPINHCPQCGVGLMLERMRPHPSNILQWPSVPDMDAEADTDTDQAG